MTRPTIKYGCEIEMFPQESGDWVETAIDVFVDAGLTNHDHLHPYHCGCSECTYSRTSPGSLLAAQTDPTVGAEFITKIMSNRSNSDMTQMRALKRAYGDVLIATGWTPDGVQNAGNHIHVGWPTGTTPTAQAQARSLLNGMFSAERDLWQETIATGGAPHMRSYNSSPRIRYDDWEGGWLGGNPGTIELRVWNTPADPNRLLVHPALSVAMVHWALEVIDEEGDIVAFSAARTTADWAANRARPSRKRIAKIVQEVWSDRTSARHAAELIAA